MIDFYGTLVLKDLLRNATLVLPLEELLSCRFLFPAITPGVQERRLAELVYLELVYYISERHCHTQIDRLLRNRVPVEFHAFKLPLGGSLK